MISNVVISFRQACWEDNPKRLVFVWVGETTSHPVVDHRYSPFIAFFGGG
jgi:hypothetical protein